MTARDVLAGGVNARAERDAAAEPAAPVAAYVDTRTLVAYTLPDGTIIQFAVDHGQLAPETITYQLAGGRIVTAVRS